MEWAARSMPVLERIKATFAKEKPLEGVRISACLHVTSETANLMRGPASSGAPTSALCASNPLSTQDDIAADPGQGLRASRVFAIKGEDRRDLLRAHQRRRSTTARRSPWTTAPTWSSASLHGERPDLPADIIGGTEETTTGVIRLQERWPRTACSCYPIVAVNDAQTKHLFDNRYGTGQSTLDGIIRATNVLIAGTHVSSWPATAGAARGVAMRTQGHGADVIVTRGRPAPGASRPSWTASASCRWPRPPRSATSSSPSPATSTSSASEHFEAHEGRRHRRQHRPLQRRDRHPGAREALPSSKRAVREFVDEYTLADGRAHLPARRKAASINLAAAEGHPAAVMDMSFANQALSVRWLLGRAEGPAQGRLPGPDGGSTRRSPALKLGLDGRRDRQADAGPEEIPGRLARRDLSRTRAPRP
ncbi:MAG: adenosylhomocysteinase [Candidatus Moduliflexus flocculans]|nr:adenosylhomocysteinase [Candidatus Moduliflexus flocculans]